MENVRDKTLYEKCKKIVKNWEFEFTTNKGRVPSKLDIRDADKNIRDAYRTYFRLKTNALMNVLNFDEPTEDTNESCNNVSTFIESECEHSQNEDKKSAPEVDVQVWGTHLNKQVPAKEEKKAEEKVISLYSQKLFNNSKFNKRNPRSRMSLSSLKSKSMDNIEKKKSEIETLSQPTKSLQENEFKQLKNLNFTLPIESFEKRASTHSINIIDQMMNNSFNRPVRKVDQGWLQRISLNTGIETSDDNVKEITETCTFMSETVKNIENIVQKNDELLDISAEIKFNIEHNLQRNDEHVDNSTEMTFANVSTDLDIISDSDEDDTSMYHVTKRRKLSNNDISKTIFNITKSSSFEQHTNSVSERNQLIEDNVNQIEQNSMSSMKSANKVDQNNETKDAIINKTEVKSVANEKLNESDNESIRSENLNDSDYEISPKKKPNRRGKKSVTKSKNIKTRATQQNTKGRKTENIPTVTEQTKEYVNEGEESSINKRKRGAKPANVKTQTTQRTTRGRKAENKSTVSESVEDDTTEEYVMEYSIKPPPKTVPRIKKLPKIKDVLVTTEIHVKNEEKPKKPLTKQEAAEEKLKKKITSGTLNENFVRIDIQKKVYARGKRHINFSKYKKRLWKDKKKALYGPDMDMGGCDGGQLTCFNCGKTGHMARACKAPADKLMPLDAYEEEEAKCPIPSLEEASEMARNSVLAVHKPNMASDKDKECITLKEASLEVEEENEDENDDDDEYAFEENDELDEFIANNDMENLEITNSLQIVQSWQFIDKEKLVKPVYDLNTDGLVKHTSPEVYEALHLFGHKSFRSGQEQACMRILSGLSTLVTLSTGSGKSLCYQLPAYLYAKHSHCISLIISPLVSLMDDQVSNMPPFLKAACLHTNQTNTQKEKVMKLIENGNINILLLSPEAVTAGEKLSGFGSLLRKLPPIAFACIDEAHCVSQWSHNFRPSYLMLCHVLRERLGIKTILGLTATSTYATSSSIVHHLKIKDGKNGIISDIPLPDNLYLNVSRDEMRDQALRNLLTSEPYINYSSVIVYCTRRDECERIASYLRTSIRVTKPTDNSAKKYKSLNAVAEPYHAGLVASKRRTVQNAFMSGHLKIVVATVAFGMGINKSDIRAVIHYNMPSSFESYVQEVGRSGRDGLPSNCHVFLNPEGKDLNELKRHIYANSMDRHVIRKLLQRIFIPCSCAKICPRHEVAFSIQETIQALDVPEENISTLMCYLELHEKRFIEVLTPAYTICKIVTYGGSNHITKAAGECPPLAMALALHKPKENKKEDNIFEFPVIDIAAAMGWDSGIVKHKLKNLEWTIVNKHSQRSNLTVQFLNLGFRLRAPGNLKPHELDETLDNLYAKVISQEETKLKQLQIVHSTLTSVAESSYYNCLEDKYKNEKALELKLKVREYFSNQDPLKDVQIINNTECAEEQIISDTRALIAMYPENNFTGRAIARIFHGIQSPNYPAVIWGRCKFWRMHLHVDFNKLCLIAKNEILRLKL